MSREEQNRRLLLELRELGFLPDSRFSAAFRRCVQPLIDAEVLVQERSGSGRRWLVRDASALAQFITSLFPEATVADDESARLRSVAQFRQTKVLSNDLPEVVTVRAWSGSAGLRSHQVVAPAAELTQQHGVFSFLLADQETYSLHGSIALVENPALFLQFERLGLNASIALYGRGICSERMLSWLSSQSAPDFQLWHLPDYDPVGLAEYVRLKAALGERVHLYLPGGLDRLFAQYSNRGLLHNPVAIAALARLRTSSLPEVRVVVELIDAHNAGLEQESLLLGTKPSPKP